MEMKVAAQLYTLRDYLKTPEQIEETLKKVKEMGYNAVQASGLGPIAPEKLKAIVDDIGLEICATHISFADMQEDINQVIENHKILDCKYVGIGGLPGEYRESNESYARFAREASELARILKDNGQQFIYHNHNFEFNSYDGLTGLEILFNESDPEVFDFELDTYWIQAGGADPIYWIKKMDGRMKVVHFKDMAISGRDQIMAEIGEGNLNWEGIIQACRDIGVEWCPVEQDVCQRSPFESLEISLNNLIEMGVKP